MNGLIACTPSGMPRFSIVSSSAAEVPPRRHSSMNAATSGRRCATVAASGCSAATAMKVAPYTVSGRVVKTRSGGCSPYSSVASIPKSMSVPSERPIQLRCIVLTGSGQSMLSSSSSSSSQ